MEGPHRLQSMGSLRVNMAEGLHFHFSLSCIGEGNGNPLRVFACRIPGTREPGGLPSMGLHRVGHDWSALAAAAAACCISQGSQQPIVCVSQLVGQRNRFIFKESAHTIIEAENSGPRRVDGVCYSKSKSRGRRSVSQLKDGQAERNFFWTQPFILFRPSKVWLRPHILGSAICLI